VGFFVAVFLVCAAAAKVIDTQSKTVRKRLSIVLSLRESGGILAQNGGAV
jgi:hypothetical protein